MPNTPLNPDGVLHAMDTLMAETDTDERATEWAHKVTTRVLEGYFAAAQPELQANSKPKQNFEVVNILEILEAHPRSFRNGRCSCEEYGPKRTFEEHDEHVAEVLEKHMQEREAEAWEQGSLDRADRGLGLADNPYKETE